MNTLGPTERALLVALQEADEPTNDDRDRVLAGVLQRVATASGIAAATWTAASTVGKAAGVGLGVAQGGASLTGVVGGSAVGTAGAVGAASTVGATSTVVATGAGLSSAVGLAAVEGSAGVATTGAAMGGAAAKVAGAALFSSVASKVAAAVVGLGLASGATWYAVDQGATKPHSGVVIVEQQNGSLPVPAHAAPVSPTADGRQVESAAAPLSVEDLAPKVALPAHKANRVATRVEVEPQAAAVDNLADEAEILKHAQQAINVGNTALALALVEEHAEKYPNGVLAQERSGVRAISLCRAGAWQQGVAQARSFLQKNPVSPLSERVRSVCKLEGN